MQIFTPFTVRCNDAPCCPCLKNLHIRASFGLKMVFVLFLSLFVYHFVYFCDCFASLCGNCGPQLVSSYFEKMKEYAHTFFSISTVYIFLREREFKCENICKICILGHLTGLKSVCDLRSLSCCFLSSYPVFQPVSQAYSTGEGL